MPIDYATAQAHFATYDTADPVGESGPIWHGLIENCDVCSRPMGSETYMIDGPAQTSAQPMWGNLCVTCALRAVLSSDGGRHNSTGAKTRDGIRFRGL
jgi:hypothetical protein